MKTSKLRQAFDDAGLKKIDTNLLAKCAGLADTHRLSLSQMVECWEVLSMNKNITELSEHSFQTYRSEIIKASNNNNNNNENPGGAIVSRRGFGKRRREEDNNKDDTTKSTPQLTQQSHVVTPVAPSKRASNNNAGEGGISAVDAVAKNNKPIYSPLTATTQKSYPQPQRPKYSERKDAGKVVNTLNPGNWASSSTKMTTANYNKGNSDNSFRCEIDYDSFPTNVGKPYRHMFTALEERASALDLCLVEMGDDIQKQYNIESVSDINHDEEITSKAERFIAPLEAVGVPRQQKVCCIGRICNSAHTGRINQTSIVLEGSRNPSNGSRIDVDVSYLKEQTNNSFSLFPGQVVAVEGINSTGSKLTAHRICEGGSFAHNQSTAQQLLDYHHTEQYQDGKPVRIMTVCGPYTSSDNLRYEPLMDFINLVKEEKPDVVIMIGPFVDLRHGHIDTLKQQEGNAKNRRLTCLEFEEGETLVVPHEAIFFNYVSSVLGELYDDLPDLATQFILVPSLDDATSEWVYPQPPLQDPMFERNLDEKGRIVRLEGEEEIIEIGVLGLNDTDRKKKRIHCVSNPCTFRINEVVFGVTGTDILSHMTSQETNSNLVPGSRLERISQHLLQQRSYYPLFPPPAPTRTMSTVNLDWKHWKSWKMPCRPDVLLVPSRLQQFSQTLLDSTVVVNPGLLTRETTGGTYAMMEIHPLTRDILEVNAGTTTTTVTTTNDTGATGTTAVANHDDNITLEHGIPDRIRVEIRKI